MAEADFPAATTIRGALEWGRRALHAQQGADALADARRLLGHATDLAPVALIRDPGRRLTDDEARRYGNAIARRAACEPVSRIVGRRGFYGRDFQITAATLDPRPETETVVDVVLEVARSEPLADRPITILDIGTGSGAILLTLLAELPDASGVGVDPSPAALAVAAANATALAVDDRCRLVEGRCLAGLTGNFDVIVSNPPYISSRDIPSLSADVRHFDPHIALDGGHDGLMVYREIVSELSNCMINAWCVFEVGDGQAGALEGIVREAWGRDRVLRSFRRKDLAGIDRCVAVELQTPSEAKTSLGKISSSE